MIANWTSANVSMCHHSKSNQIKKLCVLNNPSPRTFPGTEIRDQANAGRCQVRWRYTECALCFGWVPPGIQSTCFCLLLPHLTDFQIVTGNSVCTNRAAQKRFSGVWEIGGYQARALACLLRYTHFGNTEMLPPQIIVAARLTFLVGFSDSR